jgi:hypothetical protein
MGRLVVRPRRRRATDHTTNRTARTRRLTLHCMEGGPARRGRVLVHAWKAFLPYDEVRPSSRGRSSGITIPDDMRDLDERTAKARSVPFHACHGDPPLMMRTGHRLEARSSKDGRVTCQWMMGRPPRMEGHPSTLGRTRVETMNITVHCLEGRAARHAGSGRIVSMTGMDTLGVRT